MTNLFTITHYTVPTQPLFGPSVTIAVLADPQMQWASIAAMPEGWSRTFGQYSTASGASQYSLTPKWQEHHKSAGAAGDGSAL